MEKEFVIERLAWYLNKDLNHDPRTKFRTLASFLDRHQLSTRTLLHTSGNVPNDFQISSEDVTSDGLRFLKGGYQKWVRSVDRGGDPNSSTFLERELQKFRRS